MSRGVALLGSVAFLVLGPGTVAGLVPYWTSRWEMQRPLLGVVAFRMVGAALVALGAAALLDSFARFAVRGAGTPAPVLPPRNLIGYEEPTLRRSFGAEYEAFGANVPRWIPRVRGWRGESRRR